MPPEKSIKKITETIFDDEINQLEKRRAEIESERQKLLAGQITVKGPDGTSSTNINLGALSAVSTDQRTVDRNLRQTLLENPLVPVLDNSFKKTRELRDELLSQSDTTATKRSGSPFNRLIWANSRSNRLVSGKSGGLGKVFASPWLIIVGIIILLIWCGGPLLYAISSGTIGGKQLGTSVPVIPSPTLIRVGTPSTETTRASGQVNKVRDVGFIDNPIKVQLENQLKQTASTPTPDVPDELVGSQPSNAGGLNGPHGAFLAPSRLTVSVLSIDTPVVRAITQNNPNGDVSIVSWPRPGEVAQTGAYPGEIGNMLIMGNQSELGNFRRIQQNDEVTVYDRKGNAFIYRMLPFSSDGQTERQVNPTDLDDAWVFGPSDQAILTILVTFPQPLPAVDPNQTGNNQVTPRDDYLVQKKLAYRGMLAMYAPARVTPAGTPVMVPQSAWHTVAAPEHQTEAGTSPTIAANSPAAQAVTTANPTTPPTSPSPGPMTPGIVIPSGVPNTGMGGGSKPIVRKGHYSSQ